MEGSNSSLRANQGDNIRKVYITDSPVAEDIEYNYVSSDIEEDFDKQEPENTEELMPPEPDMTEVDELAKEAQYQSSLQDRLQKATLEDSDISKSPTSSNNTANSTGSYGDKSYISNTSSAASGISPDYKTSASSLATKSSKSTEFSKSRNSPFRSNGSGEQLSPTEVPQVRTSPEVKPTDLTEWKNPPSNPFQIQNLNTNTQNIASEPSFTGYEETNKPASSNILPQKDLVASPNQPIPNYQTNMNAAPIENSTQPLVQQQTSHQPSPTHNLPQQPYPQIDHQSNSGYGESLYAAQQQQAELERIQYQQLQQQQLQQQQLFAQQQLLLQQQRLQQAKQQSVDVQKVPDGLMMQRNAPVMYLHNTDNQNEYYAVTPRESFHPYSGSYEQFSNDQQSEASLISETEEALAKESKAIVAPKPIRPAKDYVTKNKFRAAGQHSAKPGYSDRLVQKRIEQEQLKEWAPGMVIPRKKAASADDIINRTDRDELLSAEDAWSKRAQSLAAAKQAKVAGGNKGKKRTTKISNLKRFPSDNSISKKTTRLAPASHTDPQGYLTSYQNAQGWPVAEREYELPGQISGHINSLNNTSPSPAYGKQGFTSTQLNADTYSSNIPHHPPLHQYHVHGAPVYAPHASPIYGEGGYSSQYHQHYDNHNQQQRAGPPSGALTHGAPAKRYNQNVLLNSYQPSPPLGGYHSGPPPGLPPPGLPQPGPPLAGYYSGPPSEGYHHQPREDSNYKPQSEYIPPPHPPGQPVNAFVTSGQHHKQYHQPVYDYSGYLNPTEQYNDFSHKDVKQYNGSPYGSPHPPYQTNHSPEANRKVILNPYSMVPPISDKLSDTYSTGSYVLAYQKDKEKAEKLSKSPTYKVYTMSDYKNLKLEYKLGGLGPSQDPGVLKEKMEIRNKQLQYAKGAMEQEKKKPHPSPRKTDVVNEEQPLRGRQLAVEYAKHIPKPKANTQFKSQPKAVISHDHEVGSNSSKIPAMKPYESSTHSPNKTPPTHQIDLVELEDLQRRHEQDQKAVANIQYKMPQAT